jgi:hypothetical protein
MTPNQTQLLVALRSGNYTQTQGRLHDTQGSCCLGVAAREFLTPETVVTKSDDCWAYNGLFGAAPQYVVDALDLKSDLGGSSDPELEALYLLNDDEGKTFSEIADIIEANPEAYFNAV